MTGEGGKLSKEDFGRLPDLIGKDSQGVWRMQNGGVLASRETDDERLARETREFDEQQAAWRKSVDDEMRKRYVDEDDDGLALIDMASRMMRMILIAIGVVALLLLLVWGAGAAPVKPAAAGCQVAAGVKPGTLPKARVYLMRGLAGQVYSRGMDTVAAGSERTQGTAATRYLRSHFRVVSLWETVRANHKRDCLPIIIGGHSLGADAAIDMAEWLEAEGIHVELLILFDPTPFTKPVPSNVMRAVNLRQDHAGFGNGYIRPAPGFTGRIINHTMAGPNHIQIDDWPPAHAIAWCEIGFAIRRNVEASNCVEAN
jgi:hypothetical protein